MTRTSTRLLLRKSGEESNRASRRFETHKAGSRPAKKRWLVKSSLADLRRLREALISPVPLFQHKHAGDEFVALHWRGEDKIHPPVVHHNDGCQCIRRQRNRHVCEVCEVVAKADVLHVSEGVLHDGTLDVH
mmetsp:Transcript_103520/g.183909  ORF Transcript_103520/g.183909 Transcript_103520/m.183909 type:complete len:132 (+) Transcript_103520:1-396(+)